MFVTAKTMIHLSSKPSKNNDFDTKRGLEMQWRRQGQYRSVGTANQKREGSLVCMGNLLANTQSQSQSIDASVARQVAPEKPVKRMGDHIV